MKVDLDGLDLSGICSAAIMQSIDESKREQMISEAISYLLTPKRSYGSSTTSPLQEAFEMAIRRAAVSVVESEILTKDGQLDEKVSSVIREAVERAFSGNNRETEQIQRGLRIEEF